jgi:hypothetical protein
VAKYDLKSLGHVLIDANTMVHRFKRLNLTADRIEFFDNLPCSELHLGSGRLLEDAVAIKRPHRLKGTLDDGFALIGERAPGTIEFVIRSQCVT